jgi:hypothetical protein
MLGALVAAGHRRLYLTPHNGIGAANGWDGVNARGFTSCRKGNGLARP